MVLALEIMPDRHFIKLLALIAGMMATALWAASQVTVYPESPLPVAPEFSVKANGRVIAVNNAGTFRCATFAFSGSVTVAVTYHGEAIHAFQINPLAQGVVASRQGNTLTFTLTRPEKLEIQINGATSQVVDGDKLLYLFADAPEVAVPRPDDPSVIYFGPGRHDLADGVLKLDDQNPHSALYVAPGAVLNAALMVKRTKPFKIYGRGFIQNPFKTKGHYAIGIQNGAGLVVEDVVLFDSVWHSIKFLGGHDNVIRNVKALHYVVNSDGISFQDDSSRNLVENCFIVGNDNLIVIGGSHAVQGLSNNIVRGCTFIKSGYDGNWAFPQGNGAIGPGNLVDDCDVIRCNGQVGLVRMFYGTPTSINNLEFRNIRVQSLAGYGPNPRENGLNRFLSLESDGLTYPRRMTFKNIHLPTAQPSYIAPGNWTVIFDHVYVADKTVTSDADLKLTKGAGVITQYIY